jgi:hypothetical protein
MIGRSEATSTRGFGFPASKAEIVYVRIPRSDMDDALHSSTHVLKFMPGDGKTYSFIVTGSDPVNGSCFEYVFDSEWRIQSVLSTNTNPRVRASLLKKRLVQGEIDQAYLETLEHSVEYWDGQRWLKEYSLVHSVATAR